jgi:hypothetical protein
MTVKELRDKLAGLDAAMPVTVCWEDGDNQRFFEIDDVSPKKGTPKRLENGIGQLVFTVERSGPASWCFITISPDE